MNQDPYAPFGSPDPSSAPAPPPRRRVPRLAVAAGTIAFCALAGAGVAFAVSGGSSSSSSSSSPSTASPTQSSSPTSLPAKAAPRPGFRFGRLGGGMGLGDVLHGQFTVKQGNSYVVEAVQRGQVSSVSATSLTVKSSDGFTQTYGIEKSTVVDSQSEGIGSVASGDQVAVRAVVHGATETASDVVDQTKIRSGHAAFGFGPGGQVPAAGFPLPGGGPGPADSPAEAE